jgi:hypothetical protein
MKRTLVSVVLCLIATAAAAQRHRAVAPIAAGRTQVQRVMIVVLENADASDAMRQPFLASLGRRGALLTQYHDLGHPSQPNYIAMVAGDPLGATNDNTVTLDATNLSDLLDARGVSWKVYAENYPGNCNLGDDFGSASTGYYARRHVALINFRNVQTNPARCARIVNATQLDADVASRALPQFSFYIPNDTHNGHDTSVAAADLWMQSRFGTLLDDPRFAPGTLFIVVFDEAESGDGIYCAFAGAGVQPGLVNATPYTHYDLLRTIEEIFHLGTLGRHDATAKMIDVWER